MIRSPIRALVLVALATAVAGCHAPTRRDAADDEARAPATFGPVGDGVVVPSADLERPVSPRIVRPSTIQRVRTERLSRLVFAADDGDLVEQLRRVQLVTGVPIIVTPSAREAIRGEGAVAEFDLVAPLTMDNVLDLLVSTPTETLSWRVRNDVVEVISARDAAGDAEMRLYDVRAMTFARTEFLPPRILGIPTGDDGDGSPRSGGEGEERIRATEPDQLIENVKLSTDPEYWDGDHGGTIDWAEGGYLIVTCTPAMHVRVARVLGLLQ